MVQLGGLITKPAGRAGVVEQEVATPSRVGMMGVIGTP
jgi:hypothetical protein